MIIKELHIAAFGGLVDRDIYLDRGLNIIEGSNESGKTSAAMFIKFIFYGLSGKSTGGAMSERKRYVNLQKSIAAGHLVCTVDGVDYRIERNLTVLGDNDGTMRETVRIVNLSDGKIINGVVPGEHFFGVNESMFVNTVFVGQLSRIRPDEVGLGGAVENMLSSADENINLKKATDRLNTARREIHHKNGNGGEITELKEEREALAEEAEQNSELSAELIETEASLAEAVQERDRLAAKTEELESICRIIELLESRQKAITVRDLARSIAKKQADLEKINRSGFLESYEERLNSAEQTVRFYLEREEGAGDVRDVSDGTSPAETGEKPTEDELDDAFYLDRKSGLQLSVGLAMMIVGVLGLAASAFLYYYNLGSYLIPLVMAGMCAFLGVIFFLFRLKTLNKLYDVLDYWNVDDVDDMEDLAYGEEASNGGSSSSHRAFSAPGGYEITQKEYDYACKVIFALASQINMEASEDPRVTAGIVRDYAKKLADHRETLRAQIQNGMGRLSVLKKQVEAINPVQLNKDVEAALQTPEGQTALRLDKEERERAFTECGFLKDKYQSYIRLTEELERTLADLKSKAKSPAEAAARIEEIDEIVKELELKRDGYNLAMDALKKAGGNMRSNVIPNLTAHASELMSRIVDGKYSSLVLDSDFGMNYVSGSDTLSAEHMSKGTYDAAYLSLRLGLMKVMYKSATPPVVLDESFAYIDENRMIRILDCLSHSEGQSLFFTCREKETAEANRENIPFNLIHM